MDDKAIEALGIDLSNRAAASDAAAEAQRKRDEARLLAYVEAWDKMMQRAFKGIYTRKMRHDAMHRAAARQAREAS